MKATKTESSRRLRPFAVTLITSSLLAITLLGLAVVSATASPIGLYVRDGVLMKDGSPYLGIGANYQTLFGKLLRNKDDTSTLEKMARLSKAGIPFIRYRACGFGPENYEIYMHDRAEYFRRMDKVVQGAERNKIGLIPSLFWRLATVSELLGENRDQLGNPDSKASQFIKQYTQEMVSRYKDSPAIWGWEFGAEANLGVDLPNPGMRRTGRSPKVKTMSVDQTQLTSAQLRSAYILFANTVRRIDPTRMLESGTTLPRPSAWHLAHGQGWKRDSVEQGFTTLLGLTPDPMDVLSVHIYEKAKEHYPEAGGTAGVMKLVMQQAQAVHKPMFIGEFPVKDKGQAQEYLGGIVSNRVPLSAFWVFDDPNEPRMNVDFDNERSFVLDMVVKANQELQRK